MPTFPLVKSVAYNKGRMDYTNVENYHYVKLLVAKLSVWCQINWVSKVILIPWYILQDRLQFFFHLQKRCIFLALKNIY